MKIFLLIYLFLLPILLIAQQERQLFIYNVGFGGLTSGIGAVINKSKGTDWTKIFLKGCWQGSIGGALSFAGKKTVYLVNRHENLLYAWPSKLLHAAGTSIIENAALNEPFLQNWNMDYGPVRFDFSFNGKRGFGVRLLPVSIYAIFAGSRGAYFDPGTTLLTGNVSFYSKYDHVAAADGYFQGLSYGRGFVYADRSIKYQVIPHELIHIYQYREYQVLTTWLKPLARKVKNKNVHNVFDRYVYPDIPVFTAFYGLEYLRRGNHFRNFYEFEAYRFSTNRDVPR